MPGYCALVPENLEQVLILKQKACKHASVIGVLIAPQTGVHTKLEYTLGKIKLNKYKWIYGSTHTSITTG